MKMLPPIFAERETGNSLGWIGKKCPSARQSSHLQPSVSSRFQSCGGSTAWAVAGAIPRGSAAEGARTPAGCAVFPNPFVDGLHVGNQHLMQVLAARRTSLAPGIDPNFWVRKRRKDADAARHNAVRSSSSRYRFGASDVSLHSITFASSSASDARRLSTLFVSAGGSQHKSSLYGNQLVRTACDNLARLLLCPRKSRIATATVSQPNLSQMRPIISPSSLKIFW